MTKVTRNVEPAGVRDLLERVPRSCIAFASDHGPQVQPVVVVWQDERYLAGIAEGAASQRPGSGQEVVLLIDTGIHYFELRAIYIRGPLKPTEAPARAPASRTACTWFEITPLKTVAWDYGMLREMQEVRDDG